MFYNININPYKITDFAQRKKNKRNVHVIYVIYRNDWFHRKVEK